MKLILYGHRKFEGDSVPLNVIDSSTKGFLEILSNVLVAEERSLSFTYGRPDESISSFTLLYFGKRRTRQINLFP